MPDHAPDAAAPPVPAGRRLRLTLVVWLAMAGLDLALNAAVFAGLYREGEAFLLPPLETFRRIPAGYLALLVLAGGTVELASRLGLRGPGDGLRAGLVAGIALGSAWSLGLWSIATISAQAALAFAAIWAALLTAAGAVAAAGLRERSLRGLTLRVIAADVACAAAVVALQSLGVVPTLRP